MTTLYLPTAYAPNITYISAIAHSEQFCINVEEPYVRQTFRNRCEILTSQGVQKLSIPIDKKSTHSRRIKDVKIDYAENWQRQHWRSLQASYNNSPYFLYYQDELNGFYEKRYGFLVDFNSEILNFLLRKMQIDNGQLIIDNVANALSNEAKPNYQLSIINYQFKNYQQVFSNQNFIQNLSSFDLLFNCGPESKSYLCKA
ncbi:MAG: WbqC family protein [Bacteroidales bacterium]|nr:WbqC family protein [Bacteroidales bacterium]